MTDQTNTSEQASTTAMPSLDERIDSVFGPSESAGETDSPLPPSADAASPAGSEDANAQARAQRRAERESKRLELNARQRARVDATSAQREAEDLRKKLADYEARSSKLVDPSQLDPLKIIELGQRAGHSPAAMGEALRNALGSPELAAAHAARSAVDPEISELKKSNAEMKAMIDGFVQQQKSATEQAQEREAMHGFSLFTQQNAATSPLTARFLELHGPDEFTKLTKGAASALSPDADAQALLDEIEDRLTEVGKLYAAPAATQRQQANPPRTHQAAAQAPTHVTNSLAQQRSGVVDGNAALAKMSLIERANLAFSDS